MVPTLYGRSVLQRLPGLTAVLHFLDGAESLCCACPLHQVVLARSGVSASHLEIIYVWSSNCAKYAKVGFCGTYKETNVMRGSLLRQGVLFGEGCALCECFSRFCSKLRRGIDLVPVSRPECLPIPYGCIVLSRAAQPAMSGTLLSEKREGICLAWRACDFLGRVSFSWSFLLSMVQRHESDLRLQPDPIQRAK